MAGQNDRGPQPSLASAQPTQIAPRDNWRSASLENFEPAALFIKSEIGERQKLIKAETPHVAFRREIEQMRLDFVGEQKEFQVLGD